MGHDSSSTFNWQEDYRILEKNFNDGTLIIEGVNPDGRTKTFIGREIFCSSAEETHRMRTMIQRKQDSPSPYLTKLESAQFQHGETYCSDENKIYLLFENPGTSLKEEIIGRRFAQEGFSEDQADILVESGCKAIRELKSQNHPHNNISSAAIFVNEERQIIVGDPWITPPAYQIYQNNNGYSYPSPEKILYQNDQLHHFCPFRGDLFSLGVVTLEALNLQHMDILYEKGFRRVLQSKVDERLRTIKNQSLRSKLELLLSFDPRKREDVYRLYNENSFLTELRKKNAKIILDRANGIIHEVSDNQPEYDSKNIKTMPSLNSGYRPSITQGNSHFKINFPAQQNIQRGRTPISTLNEIEFQNKHYSKTHDGSKIFHPTPIIPMQKTNQTGKVIFNGVNNFSHQANMNVPRETLPAKKEQFFIQNSQKLVAQPRSELASKFPSQLPLLAQIPSVTSTTFIQQNPVSTYKPNYHPITTPPPTPVDQANNIFPGLNIPFTHTIEDWKFKLDESKKGESYDCSNYVLDSVEDKGKTELKKQQSQKEEQIRNKIPEQPNTEKDSQKQSEVKEDVAHMSIYAVDGNIAKDKPEGKSLELESQSQEIVAQMLQLPNQTPERRPKKTCNSTIKQVSQNSSKDEGDQPEEQMIYVIEEYNVGKYEGFKKNGMRNGRGKFYYNEGSIYEGQWKDNQMHGYGTLFYASGMVAYEGQWNEDEFHGVGKVYNEEQNKLTEPYDYEDLDFDNYWVMYEGELNADRRHGKGKVKLSNGEVFAGTFDMDMIEGQGKYYTQDGKIIHGIWKNNKLIKRF